MVKKVTMDFETRSKVNLKISGAYVYSLDPSTRPTCLAFKFHGENAVYLLRFETVNLPWKKLPAKVREIWLRAIEDEEFVFSAHNAFFETCIYKNILVARLGWPDIDFRRFRCTAAKAAACALPRNLEGAGAAMKLRVQKDKRGYNAMMATCKPTRKWNDWIKARADLAAGKRLGARRLAVAEGDEPPMFLEPDAGPEVFETLYTYCKIDVRAEEQLDDTLPDLSPEEQEIWFLNQRLNWRGIAVDMPVVDRALAILSNEESQKKKELDSLTMGLVTSAGARQQILDFLALEEIVLPDLKAKTIDDVLKNGKITGDMKTLLEIRKALSKTSTKKYQTLKYRSHQNRIRDILLYHGASTGRDTGTGFQPHNLPRGVMPKGFDQNSAIADILSCDVEMLKILYGENLSFMFSSILRGMLIPTPLHEMFVADFSKIEVAVLWWIAGNEAGLEILRAGKDPYIYQAAGNLGKTYEEIEAAVEAEELWALDARQLGKAQILGCGFGMGGPKFQLTAFDQYRLKLSLEQSNAAVKSYREANAPVPQLWKDYERAAIMAVEDNVTVEIGKCKFELRWYGKIPFLVIELPSGRPLSYCEPQIVFAETQFGPRKQLEFWGAKGKHWRIERTWGGTITENVVQATARDLMMPAMLRLERAGYSPLLMVHDEGICERKVGKGSVEEFTKIMTEPPAWADGLPLEAKGWKGPRYRK